MFNYLLTLLFIIISQLVFNYLRTIELKFIMKNMVKETMLVAFFISISLLSSTFISFKALLDGDYIIATVYIIFGLIGKYLGLMEYKMDIMVKFFKFKKLSKKMGNIKGRKKSNSD